MKLIRWILVLPTAIIGFAVAAFVINLLIIGVLGGIEFISPGISEGILTRLISLAMVGAAAAYGYIIPAIYIAPTNKKMVAKVMTIILWILLAATAIYGIYQNGLGEWEALVSEASTAIAVLFAREEAEDRFHLYE